MSLLSIHICLQLFGLNGNSHSPDQVFIKFISSCIFCTSFCFLYDDTPWCRLHTSILYSDFLVLQGGNLYTLQTTVVSILIHDGFHSLRHAIHIFDHLQSCTVFCFLRRFLFISDISPQFCRS